MRIRPFSIVGCAVALAPVGINASLAASTTEPPELSPAAISAVTANNGFGLDLYRAVGRAKQGENLFLSPYSMSIALTMTAEGARNETETEMARVMRLPSGARRVSAVHGGYAELSQRFRAAAGSADAPTRERIAKLKAQLKDANAKAESLSRDNDWQATSAAQSKAESIAAELNSLLPTVDRFDLRTANALWVARGFQLQADYTSSMDRFYGAGGVSVVDFAGRPELSRLRINTWVEDHTEHRIKELIPKGALNPDTRLVITNAVYFLGQWANPFRAESTAEEDFTAADGARIRMKMMNDHWRGGTPYAAFNGDGSFFETPRKIPKDAAKAPPTYPGDDGFSMISIAYKGGELSMVIIAPRLAGGLSSIENLLTPEHLQEWLSKLDSRTVDTAVPRFTLTSTTDMSPVLVGLGMKQAFTDPAHGDGAEFPGISASRDSGDQLFIGAVLHKAWVEVNEKGTEAAAATSVMLRPTSAAFREEEMVPFTPQFRADRPFIFLIRDAKSGLILFIGRITSGTGL